MRWILRGYPASDWLRTAASAQTPESLADVETRILRDVMAEKMKIRRDFYLDQLVERKHNGLVKVITGLRRVGKSYLLF